MNRLALRYLPRAAILPAAALFQLIPCLAGAEPILSAPTQVTEHLYAWLGPHGGPNPEHNGFRMNMGFIVGMNAVAVNE